MAKAQAHFRLEPELLEAIKSKAEEEKITVTDLVTRLLKQGLGLDIQTDIQTVNQIAIEETVYQRISERVAGELIELEQCVSNSISKRITEINDNWEKRISEYVAERISELDSHWESRVSEYVTERISKLDSHWESRVSERISNIQSNDIKSPVIQNEEREPIPKEKATKLDTLESENISSNIPIIHTSNSEEIKSEGETLILFDTTPNEQIIKPSKLTSFLNEKTNSEDWNIYKLKGIRLRQLTWIKNYKNPEKKIKNQSPLPLVVGKYLIDWVISDEDNNAVTGKEWWIKELPDNQSEVETLIEERRNKYILHFCKNNV